MLETVELADRADEYVERFSMGLRQRLVLARALLPDPPLLLLDEPTVRLDPQAARHMRQPIQALRAAGRTVPLTTHCIEEADQFCERIAIIDGGRIAALGTPRELKRRILAEQVVRLEVSVDGDESTLITRSPGAARSCVTNGKVRFAWRWASGSTRARWGRRSP